jgi:hypothetical protein
MTRFLSEVLGAPEPSFSQGVAQLELAAGRPGTDIRISSDITRRTRAKIAELGLDPADTTGPELYGALKERLARDEQVARRAMGLGPDATPEEVVSASVKFVERRLKGTQVFGLKASVARKLFKPKLPKVAMRHLGYRSGDSMLKHETAEQLLAAATLSESESWQRRFREQYARLTPADFESRQLSVVHPAGRRWRELSSGVVDSTRHNIVTLPELGAVVVLPIEQALDGLGIATILLTASAANELRAYSSFLKLQSVKPEFGKIVQANNLSPLTSATLAGRAVPWATIQRYYSRFNVYHPEVFEPHVQAEDLKWVDGEKMLGSLDPALSFWADSSSLGLIDGGEVVSMSALDVALNYCNKLPFNQRLVHFLRDNLWHELMINYLHQENLEAAVHQQLAGELVGPSSELLPQESEV